MTCFDWPALSEPFILRPFDMLTVVPSAVEGRLAQDERRVEGLASRSVFANQLVNRSLPLSVCKLFERILFTS